MGSARRKSTPDDAGEGDDGDVRSVTNGDALVPSAAVGVMLDVGESESTQEALVVTHHTPAAAARAAKR